ncbi:TetR/AcrR family transcriptional regulator [Sphingomonas arenae]|uniref:TetR/AcrR family transcriptional regulator n=1 Tax=Sphingomonas arenae TaxID=2812555 RepID=UPI0019671F53|nr:TetR/AcrR family transcriptional regulator [Sphingomonas arenae]
MAKAATVVEFSAGQQRLVQGAMRLFAEKGFDGVTVRDIASAAGVSVGLINHHFGSKEGLRDAVDRYFLKQFEEVLFEYMPRGESGSEADADAVAEWIEAWIERHIDDWELSKAYMRRALLEGSEWGGHVFERFYQVVRTSVDRMDAEGRLRGDVDRLWLPLLIMYLELGTLLLEPYVDRVLGRSGFDRALWRRRHRAYVDLVFRGVRPEPS